MGTGGLSPVVALLSHGDNEQGVCTMNMALSPSWSPNVPSFGANRRAADAPSGLPSPAVTMVSPPSKATPKIPLFGQNSQMAQFLHVTLRFGGKRSQKAAFWCPLRGPLRFLGSRAQRVTRDSYFCPQASIFVPRPRRWQHRGWRVPPAASISCGVPLRVGHRAGPSRLGTCPFFPQNACFVPQTWGQP